MRRYVYLAGPIAGCDPPEAEDWRDDMVSALGAAHITGISPLRCEPLIGETYEASYDDVRFGTPKAISSKNWFDTMHCDMVLAYLPKELNDRRPSIGTMFEIGWATGVHKPVVLVTDDEYYANHPLIKHNVSWVVDNFDDALDIICGVLGVYT